MGTGFIDGFPRRGGPGGGEGGDEHEASRGCVRCGFEHVRRPVAVGAHELVRIAGADAPRHVVNHLGARAPVAQRGGVVQIALHQAHVAPAEGVRLRGVADEARHLVAARAQRLHEVRTDESRAAGDERLHSGLS